MMWRIATVSLVGTGLGAFLPWILLSAEKLYPVLGLSKGATKSLSLLMVYSGTLDGGALVSWISGRWELFIVAGSIVVRLMLTAIACVGRRESESGELLDSWGEGGSSGVTRSVHQTVVMPRQTDVEGRVVREGRLVRLGIPRIGDSEDAYGRTLAYFNLDTNKDAEYEHSFHEELIGFGLARTTDFSHEHRREYERLREEAEERSAGLWEACPRTQGY